MEKATTTLTLKQLILISKYISSDEFNSEGAIIFFVVCMRRRLYGHKNTERMRCDANQENVKQDLIFVNVQEMVSSWYPQKHYQSTRS